MSVKRNLWIATIVIHTAMIALIGMALNVQLNVKANYEATATMAQILTANWNNAHPSPTRTATPLHTQTATSSPTFTASPTLTLTPTATFVPCIAELSPTIDHVVYSQPSAGRKTGSLFIAKSELLLFAQLNQENWWLTQVEESDGDMKSGWVQTNDLIDLEDCGGLNKIDISTVFNAPGKSPKLIETFSDFETEWLYSSGSPIRDSSNGIASLLVRSGDNQPLTVTPKDKEFSNSQMLVTSLDRINYGRSSYIGVIWVSSKNPDDFIELRIESKNCAVKWIYEIDNVSDETEPLTLGETIAGCGTDGIDDFIFLSLNPLENNKLQFIGRYNDAELPQLTLDDPDNLFELNTLKFVVYYGEVRFHYILIADAP